jgi:hypothetical protein
MNKGRCWIGCAAALFCMAAQATFAGWVGENNIARAGFGWAVAGAGDLNGDGFDDVIVGAPFSAVRGMSMQGFAYVYMGSAAGLSPAPSVTLQDAQSGWVLFGSSVSGAGDVNGDGFDDVIVGAPHYNQPKHNEGRAYLFLGSARGISSNPAWVAVGNLFEGFFGCSVGTAGDVNGDGFSDIIVGQHAQPHGRAFAYYGSPVGLSSRPAWIGDGGSLVASAGDINGDGFSDVMLYGGSFENNRQVHVYFGSEGGLASNPSQTLDLSVDSARAAGDVNGDGYDDIILGNAHGNNFSGEVYLYLGSPVGLAASAHWTGQIEGAFAFLGTSIAAGDVDVDGHIDIIAVAAQAKNENYDHPETLRSYLFRGSKDGLSTNAELLMGVMEGDFYHERSYKPDGTSLSSLIAFVGDVNGNGFPEMIMGAPSMDNGQSNEGQAYLLDEHYLNRTWDAGRSRLGVGWMRLSWFGDYAPMGGGWIYHNRHGFWYAFPNNTPDSIFFWSMDMGWLWTSSTTYTYLYHFDSRGWLYYEPNSEDQTRRWFLNMSNGQWESWPLPP